MQHRAWTALLRRLALWGVPLAVIGVLVWALGVPWWIVLPAIGAFVLYIIFEA